MFIPKEKVISIISDAILNRSVLNVKYQHTRDDETVLHKLAPFDIGSTNPNTKIRESNAERLYAFSFTHKDDNGNSKPTVCAFNINNFIEILPTNETFDETDLAIQNLERRGYDYRKCKFALHPDRDWFK